MRIVKSMYLLEKYLDKSKYEEIQKIRQHFTKPSKKEAIIASLLKFYLTISLILSKFTTQYQFHITEQSVDYWLLIKKVNKKRLKKPL